LCVNRLCTSNDTLWFFIQLGMIYCYVGDMNIYPDKQVTILNKEYTIKYVNNFYVFDIIKNILLENTPVILDTETTGLSPHKDKVIMLQLGNINNQIVIDTRLYNITRLKTLLSNYKFYGANLKFDYNMLKQYNITLDIAEDILLNSKILDSGETDTAKNSIYRKKHGFSKFSMAGVYYDYFNIALDKETTKMFLSIGSAPYKLQHILYGVQDIIAPLEVLIKQDIDLQKNGFRNKFTITNNIFNLATFEAQVSLALGDMEYNGMPIDVQKWLNLETVFKNKQLEAFNKLNIIVEKTKLYKNDELGLFGITINYNSNKQVLALLRRIKNIDLIDKATKKESVGKNVLMANIDLHPIIKILLEFRKYTKAVGTYGKAFINKHVYNGRLYTSFNQIVSTGRTSSFKPNIQNIPSDKEVRQCFTPANNNKIINCDYSGQELRITANKCKDPKLIDFFLHGDGDLHSLLANIMFELIEGVPQTISKNDPGYSEQFKQKKRSMAKTLNFKLDYGGSTKTIATSFDIKLVEAEKLYNAAINSFPVKKKYFRDIAEISIERGYIMINNITHRKRKLPNYSKYKVYEQTLTTKIGTILVKDLKNNLLEGNKINTFKYKVNKNTLYAFIKLFSLYKRLAMNTPTQGTAGDMTKAALYIARKELIKNNLFTEAMLIAQIHDEILIETSPEYSELVNDIIKYSMEKAGKVFCDIIPMTAEPVISTIWEH